MPGGSGENNHPTINKTAPRIDRQGKGRVFIPPDDSRPLQEQTRPVQG
ncbi:hypothetical protein [Propionibacterium phage pa63]|nr:hypothetical protein [Propionibacterium phage pa63]